MPKTKFFKNPEKLFSLIAIIFGTLYLLITPPFQVADEYQHYFRSYEVSELTLISQKKITDCYRIHTFKPASLCVGGTLPLGVFLTAKNSSSVDIRFHPEKKQNPDDLLGLLKYRLNPKNRLFVSFPNTAIYSPIPYFPQALGMAMGRILQKPPIVLIYLGRLSNLLTWTSLIYLTIKIIPFYKWLIFLLALTPMSLFQASSLSADAFTNGISFLFIATILSFTFAPFKFLKTKNILILGILAILLGLSKSAYFSLLFLFLIIPISKLETPRKYWTTFALLLTTSLTSVVGWSILVKKALYVPLNSIAQVYPNQQLSHIFNHPLEFINTLVNSILTYGQYGIEQFIGRLGWLDTVLPPFLITFYTILLLIVSITSYHKQILLSVWQKAIFLLILILNALLIATALYLTWTPVGAKLIEGVQGRYFLPISPLFFLLFYNQNVKFSLKLPVALFGCFSLFSCSLTFLTLLKRYW
ncbi:MAG TPA: DUF2142 domain-containing protein [Halomicronema sp.]